MIDDDILRMAIECQLVTTGNREGIYSEALMRFARMSMQHEREECAQVCIRMADRCDDIRVAALEVAAENIRARSNT